MSDYRRRKLRRMFYMAAMSGGAAYSAEAQQFFERITEPGATRKGHYATLIDALVSAGVWAKTDCLHIYAADSSDNACVNLKSSAHAATLINSPTFAADRGFTTNGSSSYVDTNFNASTAGGNYTQDAASFGVWSRTSGGTASGGVGQFDGSDGTSIVTRNTSDDCFFRVNQAGSSGVNDTVTDGSGFFLANRSGASATQLYRNGAALTVDATPNQTSTALNNLNFHVGEAGGGFAARQWAAFYVGGNLSSGEVTAFYNAMLAYMQAVGAA